MMQQQVVTKSVISTAAILALFMGMVMPAFAAGNGFDENGYNYKARIFVGDADGSDKNIDGTVYGDPTYANDHLVMKWSKAWDAARFDGADWTLDAWVTNQWIGMMPDGSQTTETVKIIWVGPELEDSPYWREGGYAIWGQFEVIADHGMDSDGTHFNYAHATPNGLGGSTME